MLRNKKITKLLLGIILLLVGFVGTSHSAFALVESYLNKAAAYNIYRCYTQSQNGTPIMKNNIALNGFNDISSLFNSFDLSFVKMPDSSSSCSMFLTAKALGAGLKVVPSSTSDKIALLYRLGYESSDGINFSRSSARGAATTAANSVLGTQYTDVLTDSKFTEDEKYQLYSGYLRDVYGISAAKGTLVCGNKPSGDGWNEMPYLLNGSFQTCYARVLFDNGVKVPGLNSLNYFTGTALTASQLISALQAANQNSSLTATGAAAITNNEAINTIIQRANYDAYTSAEAQKMEQSSVAVDIKEIDENCRDAGVKGISWIVCPAMTNMVQTVTAMESLIQSMLSVDSELYDNDSSTRLVWEYMRNIANFIISAILLIIIFSQLTGYGIDNYGIKRMLPKLIVMAILLNLSFYICELAVDVSNIAGVGLRDLFATIASNADPGKANIVEGFVATAISVLFTAASAGGAIAGTGVVTAVAFAPTMVMAVIVIVLALLVVIVAILLFFLALGARMIIIVFCVAISPLAFACYILPNTQKLFKRWWSLFEAALIIFPLCGAVMGISYIIKAIVSNADGAHIWMWIVAIFLPYLPFFLIPTLLKNSISALGTVGGALTSMGGAFRTGILRGGEAVRNSEAFKSAQEITNRNRANWQAGFKFDRRTGRVEMRNGKPVEANVNGFRRFISGGTIGMAKAREQSLKNEDAGDSEDNIMADTNIYSAQRVKDQNKQTYKVEEANEGVARVTTRYARQDAKNRRITEEEKYAEGLEQVSHEYARRTARNERLEKQAKIDELPANARYSTLRQRAANQRMTDQAKMRRAPVMTEAYANQLADNEVEMEQGKIDVGAPNVSRAYAHRVASNAKINEQAKIDNLPAQMTREYANQTAANESIRQRAQINEGAVRTNYAYEKQMAENARLGQQAKIDVGAPVMQRGTLEAIANNERLMTNAQQQVGVAAINEQIARSRAEASRDSQEYKLALDQFSNLDKSARQAELWRATYGSGTGAGARTRAAFDSLFKTGDMDEILQVMQNIQPATLDPSVRESLVQSASASGNVLLKGWAKTNGMINLNNYITSPAGNNGGLRDYINNNAGAHALDNMDKDTLKIISEVPGSASALAPIVLRNAAVSSANQNAVSRQAIIKLINDPSSNKNAIGNEFSASDLTKISAEVARALGPTALAKAIAEAKKPGNESILASIPTPVKQELGIA